ncbi:FAD-binding oxidoreductase [Actinophytocola sp.]|uniref:FAD-binding oxidoreductase n=1 Tax=Actinophytocola sp. TaxID=1872138 RepID=UPI002D763051|nr:FAD-binding oxidoreductase [Actinophytocola sp.]HYQ66486.1 FAD-binding oxidoreductase [Actinophytocola sp.]
MITHRPGDPGYQKARKLFIGRHYEMLPQAILECGTEDDVVMALDMARGGPFAIRGGGHSLAEHSTSDGLVLDLAGLTTIDVREGTVLVGAGIRVGELTDVLASLGLVVPVAWCRSVGVVGAVLGGGHGVLGRYYGLGADHLVAARVLLADGRIVSATAEEHSDLFWALRGAGGGNFGIVLSVELRTRPSVALTSLQASWPYDRVVDVVAAWQHLAPAAAREVNLELSLSASDRPDEEPEITLFGVVAGNLADAHTVLAGYTDRAGATSSAACTVMSKVDSARHCAHPGNVAERDLPRLPANEVRPALRLARSEFFTGPMSRPVLEKLAEHLAKDRLDGVYRDLELIPWGGALSEVAGGAAGHPRARFLVKHSVRTGCRAGNETRASATEWVNGSWSITNAVGSGGSYPNYADAALEDWPEAYYGANLSRLQLIKRKYDPGKVFRFDQGLSATW